MCKKVQVARPSSFESGGQGIPDEDKAGCWPCPAVKTAVAAAPAMAAALAPELGVEDEELDFPDASATFVASFPHSLKSAQTRHGFFFAAFCGFPKSVG